MSTGDKATAKRLVFIQIAAALWMVAIGAKLVWLQVKQHESLVSRATRQQQAEINLSPMRGVILDRNGNELARSVSVKSLYASPGDIADASSMADTLADVLDIDRNELYRRLTSGRATVAVKRKLDDKEVDRIEKLGLSGLRFVDEMKRFYVSGANASHVL